MTFSEKLTILRKKKGMSQEQLAEHLNVSRQSVSKWESQQALPETSKVIMIAEVFGVSIDLLLKDEQSIEYEASVIKEDIIEIQTEDKMYCTKCGKQNAADSVYCRYCRNPFISLNEHQPVVPKKENKFRKSMKIWMIICFAFAGAYVLLAVTDPPIISGTLFFGILGFMFCLLALSPKENKYMFGKTKGLKKVWFVIICVFIACVSFAVIVNNFPPKSITVSNDYFSGLYYFNN